MPTGASRLKGIGAALIVVGLACPRDAGALAAPAAGPRSPAPPAIDVSGASTIEYEDATQEWVFRGARVVIVRGTVRIEAPEILYHAGAHQIEVLGGGTISTPTFEVGADRIVAMLPARHVMASGSVRGRFLNEAAAQGDAAGRGDAAAQGEASPGGDAAQDGRWATFSAETVEADDRPDAGQVVATGQVAVLRGNQQLRADRSVDERKTRQGTAGGHAVLVQGSDRLLADHLVADLDRGEAEARGQVRLGGGALRGVAGHGPLAKRTQTVALDGHVVLYRGRARLEAERATIRFAEHTTIAEGHPAKIISGAEAPPPETSP